MQAAVNKKQTREYNNMKQNTLSNLILIAYLLMMIVSLVSAVDLFTLSHPSFAFGWIMSVAIEISIAALLIVNRKAPSIKSVLYVLGFITLFQICANTYSAYIHIENISPFAELFALDEWEVIDQKRMLAFATGGVLPAICLALIYIQNEVREQTGNNNKEPDNIEDVQIPSDEDGGEAGGHIDQPISESESTSEEVPTPQQQDESAKDADINTESEEQAEIATEQLSETDESNDQREDTVEPEAAVEEPKKRKYTKKSTSKTAKKTSKKTKTSKSNKKSKASKKAEEQASANEVSVTDVPESDPDSQSQESVAELAERLNDIRRGKHNPVSNGYSMML